MTQEFVTLPREVVELAIEAIGDAKHKIEFDAIDALIAALDQPQNHIEQHLGMVPAGWKLVPVEPTREMIEAGKDAHYEAEKRIQEPGAWKQGGFAKRAVRAAHVFQAMLAAAPQPPVVGQPQGEQEAAPNGATHIQLQQGAFYKRVDGKWYVWSLMKNGEPHRWYISPGTAESCLEPLATTPKQKREPLTDEQIDAIADAMPGGLEGFMKGWGWRQFARAVLEAAPQPPTTEQSSAVVEECLTDELKPRFSAHDDAERLKSVARGMSYNDHGEAIWKHTLMEIAVRLESGGYAAPQPPALEHQVEKESTCKDYLQVEQEPVAWLKTWNSVGHARTGMQRVDLTPECETWLANMFPTITPLYTHPQPKLEPLTDAEIGQAVRWFYQDHRAAEMGLEDDIAVARAIEAAHNIK